MAHYSPIRVCIYTRVSTSRQADNELSLTDQFERAQQWCDQNGAVVVDQFVEPGASAMDDDRPQFQQMMHCAMSDERPYDVILVHSLSRLFRNAEHFMVYRARLKHAKVKIVSNTQPFGDDPASELAVGILALFDEYNSKETAKHVRRTMIKNAALGFWNGQTPPLGYNTYEADRIGGKSKKKLEIKDEEAPVVRKIFDLYLVGPKGGTPLGITRVAAWLNDNGFKYRGRKFHVSNVQAVLRNTAYVGVAMYNKRDSKSRELRPECEWVPIPVPAIINEDDFASAQMKLSASRIVNTPARVTTTNNLLIGVAVCGCGGDGCGGGMVAATGKSGAYRYYACSNRMRAGRTACTGRRIPREQLDDVVMKALRKRLLTSSRLENLLNDWLDMSEKAVTNRREELRQLRARKTDLEAGIDRLLDLIVHGQMSQSDELFSKKLHQQKQQLAQVKADIAMTERQLAGSIRKITPKVIERFTLLMRERLSDADPAMRRFYVNALVGRVEVGSQEIRISGNVRALQNAVAADVGGPISKVRSIERKWCARQDSNLWPPD